MKELDRAQVAFRDDDNPDMGLRDGQPDPDAGEAGCHAGLSVDHAGAQAESASSGRRFSRGPC